MIASCTCNRIFTFVNSVPRDLLIHISVLLTLFSPHSWCRSPATLQQMNWQMQCAIVISEHQLVDSKIPLIRVLGRTVLIFLINGYNEDIVCVEQPVHSEGIEMIPMIFNTNLQKSENHSHHTNSKGQVSIDVDPKTCKPQGHEHYSTSTMTTGRWMGSLWPWALGLFRTMSTRFICIQLSPHDFHFLKWLHMYSICKLATA